MFNFGNLFKNKKKEEIVSPLYGLSFDDSVKMDKLPIAPPADVGTFCGLNKDIGSFEVISIDVDNQEVVVCEVCTSNQFKMSYNLYHFLFIPLATPVLNINK